MCCFFFIMKEARKSLQRQGMMYGHQSRGHFLPRSNNTGSFLALPAEATTRVLPVGLALSPRVFTRCLAAALVSLVSGLEDFLEPGRLAAVWASPGPGDPRDSASPAGRGSTWTQGKWAAWWRLCSLVRRLSPYAYPSGWGAIESCCWKWKRSLIIWMAPLHDQPSDNVYTRTVEPLGRLPLLSCHQTNSFLCQQFEPCIYSLCRVTAWQKKKKNRKYLLC